MERQDINKVIDELRFQYSGYVDEDNVIEVGNMLGADHIALYKISLPSQTDLQNYRSFGGTFNAVVESKLINVETSELVFHDISKTLVVLHDPSTFGLVKYTNLPEMLRRVSLENSAYIFSVILNAAFDPSSIGIIFDGFYVGDGAKVNFPLINGPAQRAGIKKDDIVIEINGHKVHNIQEAVPLTYIFNNGSKVVVKRNGREMTFNISF